MSKCLFQPFRPASCHQVKFCDQCTSQKKKQWHHLQVYSWAKRPKLAPLTKPIHDLLCLLCTHTSVPENFSHATDSSFRRSAQLLIPVSSLPNTFFITLFSFPLSMYPYHLITLSFITSFMYFFANTNNFFYSFIPHSTSFLFVPLLFSLSLSLSFHIIIHFYIFKSESTNFYIIISQTPVSIPYPSLAL